MSILGVKWWVHALRAIAAALIVWAAAYGADRIPQIRPVTVGLVLLLITLFFALRWGPVTAVVASLVSALAFDYHFQPPVHTFGFDDAEGVIAVFTFMVTSIAVSYVSLLSEKRANEATQGRREAERLNHLGDALLPSSTSKAVGATVVENLITHFGAQGAALELTTGEIFRAGSVVAPERFSPDSPQGRGEVVLPVCIGKETVARLAINLSQNNGGISTTALNAISRQLTMVLSRVRANEQLLHLAADIQMGMLPSTFPAFPRAPEIDLHATIVPAQDVGGDFYDYFVLPDGRICFIIGDVSDKGIPAALFMAMVVTAFQIIALAPRVSIAETMAELNRYVCDNNRSQMFVTALAGIIDLKTGTIEYSDGGHEPPFVIRRSGAVEMVEKVGGIALGIMRDHPFAAGSIHLDPGDTLLLYTDGVNEAMNNERKLFGTPTIGEVLRTLSKAPSAQDISTLITQRVKAFVAGAPQSDDITMLVVRYLGAAARNPVPASSAQSAR
jgi:serine phosphatase RsbU (regulator of sigma subunit)